MATSELELAREAKRELDHKQRLADKLPQLERQHKRETEIANAKAGEASAKADLDDILIDFTRRKVQRDKKLDAILKQFSAVIVDGQSFDQLCRSVQKLANDVAYHKLVQSVGKDQMDNDLVKAHGEQELIDRDLWPLSKFSGDTSDASRALLAALSQFVDLSY